MSTNKVIWVGLVLTLFSACRAGKDLVKVSDVTTNTIAKIKQSYAPDKRVAIFAVEASSGKNNPVLLKGATDLPNAKKELLAELQSKNISFVDSIQVFPAAVLGDKTYGVVSISVANIRSKPEHSAELATQATLGTPVKILNKESNWYLIQTPDQYISWVDAGGIYLMNEQEFGQWQMAKKIIFLNSYGLSLSEPKPNMLPVSDLVSGNVLSFLEEKGDYYKVAYPDGRKAYVHKNEAMPYDAWLASLSVTEESLVSTAKKLMGVPYLWGGTSSKGVDCSGFTKTVYFLNGFLLPRDASQQVHTGDVVDTLGGFEQLKPGDLLFFGKPATGSTGEKVVHVGMWIGNNEFIHASGKVTVASVDEGTPNYDEFNTKRLLRVKRILNTTTGRVINLQSANMY